VNDEAKPGEEVEQSEKATSCPEEAMTPEALLEQLDVDPGKGLSADEVKARQDKYGFNEIPEKNVNPIIKFLKYFWGPIPWMIEAAVILSATERDWDDVVIIGFLLLMNATIEFIQSHKADSAIASLKQSLASKARALRDGDWMEIEARELVPGDIIRIRLGDVIPADVKLVDGDYLSVDQAALTGESLPVQKHVGDVAYSGSIAKQGEMNGVVYGTALNTFFGRTAKLVAEAKTTSHFQKAVVNIGNYLIILNFILVALVLIVGLHRGDNTVARLIQYALVLTVASIPAALPAVLSVTMAVGALALSKKKAIISKLVAIEEMAGMDVLCSDKTGTITQNKLSVKGLYPLGDFKESDLLLYGTLASKAENDDPIDMAFINKADADIEVKKQLLAFSQKEFTPFDPVKKRTESLVRKGPQEFKTSKGAPQVILALTADKDQWARKVTRIIEEAGEHGYRTMGVARTYGNEWKLVGLIALNDPPREDSAATIEAAEELGVRVKMITGDHGAIAKEVAREVHIGDHILEAEKLSELPDRKALELVEKADGFSQVFPEHKYEIVNLLQTAGHIVGMTGDGVNDAPALKKADAGIAVEGATDAARAAADIVLTLPGLGVILDAIRESRRIFQRMQSYAIYRISETIDVLFFTVLAILLFGEYPVTAIMIVLLAMFNDFPIMAIATDNVGYSKVPERWKMSKVITVASVLGFTNVLFTFLVFLIGKFVLTPHLGWTLAADGLAPQVKTLVFAELAVAGNMTVFLARCHGPLWAIWPGKGLFWSSLISKIVLSLFCAFGWFMAPIGWWVVAIWGWASLQMLVTDRMKLLAYKMIEEEAHWSRAHLHAHSMRGLKSMPGGEGTKA